MSIGTGPIVFNFVMLKEKWIPSMSAGGLASVTAVSVSTEVRSPGPETVDTADTSGTPTSTALAAHPAKTPWCLGSIGE